MNTHKAFSMKNPDNFARYWADIGKVVVRYSANLFYKWVEPTDSHYCTDFSLIDDYKTFRWPQHKQTIDIAS